MTTTAESSCARYLRVLSVAGSDSGGGAGIQADLKTCAALGCYGMTAVTALTAQNTLGVRAIHAVPPDFLQAQLQAVIEDIGVDAVKIGMLHAPEVIEVVAWAIRHYGLRRVVLDPVMVASSGDRLIAEGTVQLMVRELFPLATLITPNLDEAALLVGHAIPAAAALEGAADELLALGAPAVLLKGGHLPGEEVVDLLALADGGRHRFEAPRIPGRNLHGTGCTLSCAIACGLASGLALPVAVAQARDYVRAAMRAGAGVRTGGGQGPLNHGFAPRPAVQIAPVPGSRTRAAPRGAASTPR